MTQLLEQALEEIGRLTDADQDAIAAVILAELESEARWDAAFAASQHCLARLAEEALAEDDAGRTRELDPNLL